MFSKQGQGKNKQMFVVKKIDNDDDRNSSYQKRFPIIVSSKITSMKQSVVTEGKLSKESTLEKSKILVLVDLRVQSAWGQVV